MNFIPSPSSSSLPADSPRPSIDSPLVPPHTILRPPPLQKEPSARAQRPRSLLPSRIQKSLMSIRRTVANNTGLLLIGSSQAFFALMNVGVKLLSTRRAGAEDEHGDTVGPLELIVVRMSITWICCITYMLARKIPHPFIGPPGIRLLLACRGFFGFFGLFGVYFSLQYLSLSDATVLTFLAPLCTTAVGALVLGEKVGWRQAGAGVCSLMGVVLIARPAFIFGTHSHTDAPLQDVLPSIDLDFSLGLNDTTSASMNSTVSGLDLGMGPAEVTPAQRVLAVGVALIGVLGATGAYTTIRAIGTRAHALHNLVAFSTLCVLVASTAMVVRGEKWVFPTNLDWLALLFMIGIFGFCAQVLLTMGLQRETAGRGTMAVYIQVVFALALERAVFGTTPRALSVLGTLIILASAIYVAVTKDNVAVAERTGGGERALEEGRGLLEERVSMDGAEMVGVGMKMKPLEIEVEMDDAKRLGDKDKAEELV